MAPSPAAFGCSWGRQEGEQGPVSTGIPGRASLAFERICQALIGPGACVPNPRTSGPLFPFVCRTGFGGWFFPRAISAFVEALFAQCVVFRWWLGTSRRARASKRHDLASRQVDGALPIRLTSRPRAQKEDRRSYEATPVTGMASKIPPTARRYQSIFATGVTCGVSLDPI
jgi:hypothetical protein